MSLEKIRSSAADILKNGEAAVVIGYTEGMNGSVRAFFARKPEDAEKLVLDSRCIQNLAGYIAKEDVKKLGRIAILAGEKALRSIMQLYYEFQLKDEDLLVIDVSDGTPKRFTTVKEAAEFALSKDFDLSPEDHALVRKIEEMTPDQRWKFWTEELSSCMKCYACRAACPLCYCTRCTVDNNLPQWITVANHDLGNFEWHMMRAMHLAERCTNCGECFRACPVKIPLILLTQKLFKISKENFNKDGRYTPVNDFFR